ANLLGTNPGDQAAIYRMETDGSGLAQVTHLSGADAYDPSIAADRSTIVFSSNANPLGQNADRSWEVFLIHADGTGLRQLTTTSGTDAYSLEPRISANGAVIVFTAYSNLTGGNADRSTEIFSVNSDGTDLRQLT